MKQYVIDVRYYNVSIYVIMDEVKGCIISSFIPSSNL